MKIKKKRPIFFKKTLDDFSINEPTSTIEAIEKGSNWKYLHHNADHYNITTNNTTTLTITTPQRWPLQHYNEQHSSHGPSWGINYDESILYRFPHFDVRYIFFIPTFRYWFGRLLIHFLIHIFISTFRYWFGTPRRPRWRSNRSKRSPDESTRPLTLALWMPIGNF